MEEINKWLGITKQQMDILNVIINLQKNNKIVSPKDIILNYNRKYQKHVQKPNVFIQMKFLMKLGFLKRIGAGRYFVELSAMNSQIKKRKNDLLTEINELKSTEEKFQTASVLEEEQPISSYLGPEGFFTELASAISDAKKYYMSASFPGVSLSYNTYSRDKIADYWLALNKFIGSGNDMYYITNLDATMPFWLAYNTLGDKHKAYKEALATFEIFREQIKTFKNYHVGFVQFPFEPGQTIFLEKDEPKHMFAFIRDSRRRLLGGLHIESKKIVYEYKKTFLNAFEESKKVTENNVDAIVRRLKADLKNKINI